VSLKDDECPVCHRVFGNVLCPRCHFEGKAQGFHNGCPKCGFLSKVPSPTPRNASPRFFVPTMIVLLLFLVATMLVAWWVRP